MAVYADFPYYQDFYCGTSITDAAAFRTAAARASEYIDNVTFGRLAGSVPESFTESVKKCACALAEVFELQRQAVVSTNGNSAKKSETQYHYSVTYSTPAETLTALLSGKSVSDYLYSICLRFLGRTGLMYRGCD
ncbi:MAG: hypothetical protein U0J29_03455 [Ruminococcus sp.]|nr:hypothetical protein [Ruminococcus sp.]